MTDNEAQEIFNEAAAVPTVRPTAGGYLALLPCEKDLMLEYLAEDRHIADDVYDRDDAACARRHIARMRELSAQLFN